LLRFRAIAGRNRSNDVVLDARKEWRRMLAQWPVRNWIDNIQYAGKVISQPSDNGEH